MHDQNGIMNGDAGQQGLHIPEHLLQEVVSASHVSEVPRSPGLFDYISRAANTAASILQTRPFSARSGRNTNPHGALEQVIAPTTLGTAVSKPPDIQDRNDSKYPQVVQPQNSVEACVFGDGGADSALEGVSVQIERNRDVRRASKAVTFQDVSRDAVMGEPSATERRDAFEVDRDEEVSLTPPSKPAVPAPGCTEQGPFEFNAAAQTTQNPYSKLVELCNRRRRVTRRRGPTDSAVPSSTQPDPPSNLATAAIALNGADSSRANPFPSNSDTNRAPNNPNSFNGNAAFPRFRPTPDPVAIARAMPPSATTTYKHNTIAGSSAAAELAPQASIHPGKSTAGPDPPLGVSSASLPVSKRLSTAPPPASRYALFGAPGTKPVQAPAFPSVNNTANALIAAPALTAPHLRASAHAAGWRIPKKPVTAPTDVTSTWVPSRARMLARRRAARVRFKPTEPTTSAAPSQEVAVQRGSKRSRVLSPGEVTAMHERSTARRRIDASISAGRRSLLAAEDPEKKAREIMEAAEVIAQRKVAAQLQISAPDLGGALAASRQPAQSNTFGAAPASLGATLTFPDPYAPPITPSTALIAEEAKREKARRVRERDFASNSQSPPAKRHAPRGSLLYDPAPESCTPAIVGSVDASAAPAATDPPTNLDSSLLFPSAQPVSALVGTAALQAHTGSGPGARSSGGAFLDLLERKKLDLVLGTSPQMPLSQVKAMLSAQGTERQAEEGRRQQRGAPPPWPEFVPPPSETQADDWPALERAEKGVTAGSMQAREEAGLGKFSNVGQIWKALEENGGFEQAAPASARGERPPSAAEPASFASPVAGSQPPVPPLFGPGSISAQASSAALFGKPKSDSEAAAGAGAGGQSDAPQASHPASANGAGASGEKDAAAAAAAAAPPPQKKKAVVSGWGDTFLQANAAESAAAKQAIQDEVDKAKAPAAAADASFGSPVPAATSKAPVSFGGPAPVFGIQDPPPKQQSSLFPSGGAVSTGGSSASFSFGVPPTTSQPPASSDAATPSTPLFGQQPDPETAPVATTSSKRRARDEGDEPTAKRSMALPSASQDAAAAVQPSTTPLFGISAPAAAGTAGAGAAASTPSTAPLFGAASTGATAASFGTAPPPSSLFGASSAAPAAGAAASDTAAASQPLFGASAAASSAGFVPSFGVPPVVSTGAPAPSSAALSSGSGISFTFGGPSAGALGASSAALDVAGGASSSAPLFSGVPAGSAATGGALTPTFGAVSTSSLFASGAPNTAASPANPPSAAVQSAPSFGGTSFGASGFGTPTGFGAPPASSAAAAVPAFNVGAPVTTAPSGSVAGAPAPAATGGFGAAAAASAAAPLFGAAPATPNGFAAASAPAASPILFGATPSAASSAAAGGSMLFGGPAASGFGAGSNAPAASNLFAASSAAGSMFGSAPAGGPAPTPLFGAAASAAAPAAASAAAPGGFMFGGGFGAPATGAASQPGLSVGGGAGGSSLFGGPGAAGGVAAAPVGANPFASASPGPFGNSNAGAAAPAFQFGATPPAGNAPAVAVTPTPSPIIGAPGNNSIFGNAGAAAPSGFGGPAAAGIPFGGQAGGQPFSAPAATGAVFGAPAAAPFGATPAAAPAFGAQQPGPFGAGGPSPFGGQAQQQQQAGPQQQQNAAQVSAMFGGNAQAFSMGSTQPQQGRQKRVTVRRRAGGRSGR